MFWGRGRKAKPHEDTRWAEAVALCLAVRPRYFAAVHPDKDIPSRALARLWRLIAPADGDEDHRAMSVLESLIDQGEEYERPFPYV